MDDIFNYFHFTFDSREVKKGSVFVGLGTGNKNGALFAESAMQNGADFLILEQKPTFEVSQDKYIVVKNALDFITNLAKQKFILLKQKGVKTISLTGSVGKTTTKDLINFLLKKSGKKVYATEGNFNNHIGLPFTILNTPFDVEFLVLEMGMNHLKEISHLTSIAPTDVRIITNIYNTHIGNFEDKVNGIFNAKTEILEQSTQKTTFITIPNLYSLDKIKQTFKGNIITTKDVESYEIKNNSTYFEYCGKKWKIQRIVTQSWLSLFLIGLEVLKVFSIEANFELEDFTFSAGRGNIINLSSNTILIDESYNANPQSVKNAISNLNLYEGKKCFILGEMRELGSESKKEHQEVYDFVKSFTDIETFFVGEEFNFNQKNWFLNVDELINAFYKKVNQYNVILIKASHSLNFNKITKALTKKEI